MLISGLQKTTLLDYPGKIACTVFLGGCNLRCPFCHNADLVLPEFLVPGLMEEKELFEFLEKRKGKLDGICITGGEPTLYLQLPELIAKIKEMSDAHLVDAVAQVEKGNKAAGARARKASLELEKVLKEFRKVSLEESKK